jgi:hypothetical protein
MRDLPSGVALLALARDVLANELMPLLPEERRPDPLLVVKCMAIAAREAAAEEAPMHELRLLYTVDRDPAELLRCFAHDLRIGAFENLQPRDRSCHPVAAANGFD